MADPHPFEPCTPSWPSLENISPELKTVFPNADFVIEGYVDPREPLRLSADRQATKARSATTPARGKSEV